LLALVTLSSARADLGVARSALQGAVAALSSGDETAARSALDRAEGRLAGAAADARSLPLRLLRPVPVVGSPVKAVAAAVAAGDEVITAGRILADATGSFPTGGAAAIDGHDLSGFHGASVASVDALARAHRHLDAARAEMAGPAGALLPPVSGPARDMVAVLDDATARLAAAERGLGLMGELTAPGTDARILLLSQDTLEGRPTGGFIGSYGVLAVADGTIALERYGSSLPEPGGLPAPEPPMAAPRGLDTALPRAWDMSNANWWPDFPTSARAAAELFARQGGGPVDGVIAITEHVMADLVGVLGPITVPGYERPVTKEGFAERVLYEVELKRPLDTPRKRFLTRLSEEVFSRLFAVPADKVPAVVDALGAAGTAGDLQVYFARPQWQAAVAGTVLDGALPPAGGDYLRLVEANLTASKANMDLVRDIDYQVSPGPDGRLAARLRVEYRNEGPKTPINPFYNGYLRVYVPKGSEWDGGYIEDATDGSYTVLHRQVLVRPGETEEVVFEYLLASSVPTGDDYHLTWHRAPGTQRDTFTATIGGRPYDATAADTRFEVDGRVAMPERGWRRFVPFM
ncbi:MAG: DUF4012 domain-containing protein, partial [Acidimicrobiia bacterium]